MSLAAYKAVWKMDLNGAKKLVMLALADFANDTGECWPSYDTLHEMTGSSTRHLKRVIQELSEGGYLQVAQNTGRGNSNHYIIPLKGDIVSPINTPQRVTFETVKGDICDIKGDISSLKGDTMSPKPYRTVKNQKENRKGEVKKPASVHIYQTVAHLYPHKSLWSKMDETIGDDKESLLLFRQIVEGWLLIGWNPKNIKGMLDFYNRQEIPGAEKEKQNGKTKRTNGQSDTGQQQRDERQAAHSAAVREAIAERNRQRDAV